MFFHKIKLYKQWLPFTKLKIKKSRRQKILKNKMFHRNVITPYIVLSNVYESFKKSI